MYGHVTFPENIFWCATFYLMSTSEQVFKLKFECNKFAKMAVYILQTRISFYKKLRYQVDEIVGQLQLSKSVFDIRFSFIIC